MNVNEGYNQLVSIRDNNDALYDSLFAKLVEASDSFDETKPKQCYDKLVSTEYILVNLRLKIDQEHLTIKRLLQADNIQPAIEIFLKRRDVYLAQFLQKLTTLQQDYQVISRLKYQQDFNK